MEQGEACSRQIRRCNIRGKLAQKDYLEKGW